MTLTRRIFTASALAAATALAACGNSSDNAGSGTMAGTGRSLGSADAPVTMTEYSSVACVHCARFHDEVYPALEPYIEAGQMRVVLHEMLNGPPQFAVAGFSLAHCVPEERYFDTIDVLFEQQQAIFDTARSGGNVRARYVTIARSMGLSEAQFDACLNDTEINSAIVASHEAAMAEGISLTPNFAFNGELLEARNAPGASQPTYFLGGEQVVIDGEPLPARQDGETFARLIDHLLAQSAGG